MISASENYFRIIFRGFYYFTLEKKQIMPYNIVNKKKGDALWQKHITGKLRKKSQT